MGIIYIYRKEEELNNVELRKISHCRRYYTSLFTMDGRWRFVIFLLSQSMIVAEIYKGGASIMKVEQKDARESNRRTAALTR